MSFLPVELNLDNKNIVVIGGERCAYIKIKSLINYTENITVIAPDIIPEIENLGVTYIYEKYEEKYLENAFLIYACTDNAEVNKQIFNDANKLQKLCNVTDDPDSSDFHASAIITNQNYSIGINAKRGKVSDTIALKSKVETLLTIFEMEKITYKSGKVWLVGFGPGNPELLTIRA